MKASGIYKIQSITKPERCYIGSAVDIYDRWSCHRRDLKRGIHHSRKLQRHYNKYGESDIIFTIIELCFSEFLTAREQHHINNVKPYFNICRIAGSCLGLKRSDETKQKLSKSHKGHIPWSKGKHLSEEHRGKIKKIHILNKQIPPSRKGISHSEETRKKISDAMKGRSLSEEVKKKIKESAKNRQKITEETRIKLSQSHKGQFGYWTGKHLSEETKRKISETKKRKAA